MRVVKILNVNRTTFPQNRTIFTLNQYTDFKNVGHDFLPDQSYYIKYKVTHNKTGKNVEKVYPIPFTMKPLPIPDFHFNYTFTLNEADHWGVTISNMSLQSIDWTDVRRVRVYFRSSYYNEAGQYIKGFSEFVSNFKENMENGENFQINSPVYRNHSYLHLTYYLRLFVYISLYSSREVLRKLIDTPRWGTPRDPIPEIVTEETLLQEGSTTEWF